MDGTDINAVDRSHSFDKVSCLAQTTQILTLSRRQLTHPYISICAAAVLLMLSESKSPLLCFF